MNQSDSPDAPIELPRDAAGSLPNDEAGDGGSEAGEDAGTAGGEAGPRRRRRRRRRRTEAAAGVGDAEPASEAPAPPSPRPQAVPPGARPQATAPRGGEARRAERAPAAAGRTEPGGRGREDRGRRRRGARGGEAARATDERAREPAAGPRGERERGRDGRTRGKDGARTAEAPDAASQRAAQATSASFEPPTARLDPRRPVAPADDLDLEGPATPAIPWGKDDDGPPAEVVLAPDLPAEAPADELDPVSFPALDAPSAVLGEDVASVVGVRFVPGGRVQWCDAGDADHAPGDRVLVDTDRGARLAWIAVPPARRTTRDRGLRRVIRRASDQDLRGERDGEADRASALRIAKDKAAALRLPLKVFRVEVLGQLGRGGRLNVYYTSDERLDLRELIRDVSSATGGARVELRQLGVRDEAKAVGGIGSCGLTLCCTTWLPDFVPVSIKMAKDQGLVLSPTKVSGQCGRLKCCLVYEQAAYAELRKGLPKLGKRVIGARGEGRVVEVDVLRQRVRVSYGPGETEVVPATEVKPLFPSGNQPAGRGAGRPAPLDADTDEADDTDDAEDGGEAERSDPALALPDGPLAAADPALGSLAPDDDLHDDDPSAAS